MVRVRFIFIIHIVVGRINVVFLYQLVANLLCVGGEFKWHFRVFWILKYMKIFSIETCYTHKFIIYVILHDILCKQYSCSVFDNCCCSCCCWFCSSHYHHQYCCFCYRCNLKFIFQKCIRGNKIIVKFLYIFIWNYFSL